MAHPKTVEAITNMEMSQPWQVVDALQEELELDDAGNVKPGEMRAIVEELRARDVEYAARTLRAYAAVGRWVAQATENDRVVIRSKAVRWCRSAMQANWTQSELVSHIRAGGRHKDIHSGGTMVPQPTWDERFIAATRTWTELLEEWINQGITPHPSTMMFLSLVPSLGDLVRQKLEEPLMDWQKATDELMAEIEEALS